MQKKINLCPNTYLLDSDLSGPVVQKVDSTIQWIAQLVFVLLIRWIAIYPVDSAIHVLNNQGLVDSDIQHLSN